MKTLLLFLALAMSPDIVMAKALDLSGYQEKSGAITTGYRGDTVDPYFATKALLTAKDGGLNIYAPARAWISWAMRMQRPDGHFDRYSRDSAGRWKRYASADADDAMFAVWLELLYRIAPSSGLPQAWRNSASKAEAQLEKLYNRKLGIYHISQSLPVGLLMDNVEIYSAFTNIAREQKRMGMQMEAQAYEQKAIQLNVSILEVFQKPTTSKFFISTQKRNEETFYPDHAAQIFPLLYELGTTGDTINIYQNWIAANGKDWIKQRKNDYPWGLIAITALNMNDTGSASCWENTSTPMRYSKHWNVLEEAASQQIKWRLSKLQDTGIPCVGKDLL